MNNSNAKDSIKGCKQELERIRAIIKKMGSASSPVSYLTKYAIIKTCGTIELCFKTIISDSCVEGQSQQIKNYIDKTFRNSSMNPNKDNMLKALNLFDKSWNTKFKERLKSLEHKERILDSLNSLNEARNTFAHGGNPSTSFENVNDYFMDSVKIIEIIDKIVSK
ncbi:MAG: HEPN domain-containing protein [Tenuifilaceae bacterium]|nr:HEPN domain-containing protein [Tenuifilaceae bacterium]